MQVLVVGSGPTGLLAGATLARRGHQVTSVDRDPGPDGGSWARRGVMQFAHAHGFRAQVPAFLLQEWPRAHRTWLGLGARPLVLPDAAPGEVGGMFSRRETLERALRLAAPEQPGLSLRTGHVDGLVHEGGRVVGARVDGHVVPADLVVDASGRSGRMTRSGAGLDGDCGLAYVNRTYRLRPGAEPGPMNSPIGYLADFDGYQCLLFPHEGDHYSVVLVRPTADATLKDLRHEAAWDAACASIPTVAAWTTPDRSEPTSGVMVGGALRNVYRRQAGTPGLVAVGDSVATTTPTRGRGVAMACMQVGALLALLDEGADPLTVAGPFGDWCDRHIEPWVADHVAIDGGMVRRWQGHDIDLGQPLTSDLIAAAVEADPRIWEHAAGYFAMTALPETLRPAEPMARAVYEAGWRPPYGDGPTRDQLVETIGAALTPYAGQRSRTRSTASDSSSMAISGDVALSSGPRQATGRAPSSR